MATKSRNKEKVKGGRNNGGRPGKYKPAMCEQVIALMSEGASLVEVSVKLGISRQTMYRWRDSNEEFCYTIKRGLELSEAWWEEKGRTNLENKSFNSTLWYMNMKNRFGWKDKTAHAVEKETLEEFLISVAKKEGEI